MATHVDKAYLVIVGDIHNMLHENMLKRLNEAGETIHLDDNIYVLRISEYSELKDMELVRNYIAGKEFGFCMVFPIDSTLRCAWNLSNQKSDLLRNIVREYNDEGK